MFFHEIKYGNALLLQLKDDFICELTCQTNTKACFQGCSRGDQGGHFPLGPEVTKGPGPQS